MNDLIALCQKCGSFALQSLDQRGLYTVRCFNEYSSATFDCEAPEGPKSKDSDESIRLWNKQQSRLAAGE